MKNCRQDIDDENKIIKFEQAADTSGRIPSEIIKGFIINPPPIPKAPAAIPVNVTTSPIINVFFLFHLGSQSSKSKFSASLRLLMCIKFRLQRKAIPINNVKYTAINSQ